MQPRLLAGSPLAALALGTLLACTALPGAGGTGGTPVPWIDVHVHLIGGRQGYDTAGAVAAAVAAMDQAGIRTMIVMPPPQPTGQGPGDLEGFLGAVKGHPRFAFLGGGGSLNGMLQDAAGEATVSDGVRRRFEETAAGILRQGAAGFGEMTAHHLSHMTGHPYESVAADHPLLRLLADIAARHDVPIDLHLDVVAEDMQTPEWLASPPNPPRLRANLAAFERLLEHNRGAKIVWAHAGSDMLGHWTVDLSRRLLERHPNLHMSLRMAPGRAPWNHPLTRERTLKPEWLALLRDFADRFVIGGDQFIAAPRLEGGGPGLTFAQRAPAVRERTRAFLDALPADLARRVGYENAVRLYKLRG